MSEYMKKTDLYGKIWIWTAAVVVLMVPVSICVAFDAWPAVTAVLTGLLGVAPIFWTVGVIEVEASSEEGEVISTIAIATSSIVTTIILAAGVFGLTLISPILDSPVLKPAFDNILPALFGGLGVVYISKNPKLAIAPLFFMIALFLAVPSLSGSVGVLVPVGVLIALGVGRLLSKKGWV